VDIRSLRPTVVEVSLDRLAENFRAVQAAVAPAAVMPILTMGISTIPPWSGRSTGLGTGVSFSKER
jgi:hypothetical protein